MKIIPYVFLNGEWSIPYKVIEMIWLKMVVEGTASTVFCTGTVKSLDGFIKMLQSPKNSVITQWEDDKIVFIGWLTNFTANSAAAHFNCFKDIWGKRTVEAAKNAIKYWFSLKYEDRFLLDTIVGMIPDTNTRAIKMLDKCGLIKVGTIPNYTTDVFLKKKIGMTILYIERG